MTFWWIFLLVYGYANFIHSQPCPQTLPEECNCTEWIHFGLNISCQGYDIANITQQLPPNTAVFHYVALELYVQLADTNFSHVPNLKVLTIKDPGDKNVHRRKIYSMSGNDKIFQGLDKLQTLTINVQWKMATRLPGIFMGLPSLETLDLSNTRFIHTDNLFESLQGLRNNTKLSVLNLWNIQTLRYSPANLDFDLSKVLEPLSASKLQVLNVGYNAFRSIGTGLLQYAPHLKKLIVRNNILIPIVTSSLMTEVLLHKTLEEADFSEQGYRPTDKYNMPQTQSYLDIHPGYLNKTTFLESIVKGTVMNSRSDPDDFIPIPSAVIEFLKKYVACFIMLYEDTCNILEAECETVKRILSEDHRLFCTLLTVFFKWNFSGINCDYLPPFGDLISKDCGACLVVPSLGSVKTLRLQGLNIYDYVLQFPNYWDRPICFYPNTSIQYMDLSRNDPHGYPDVYKIFHTDVSGLENLSFLNCSHNGQDMLYAKMTSNFPNLKIIDASYNDLVLADKGFIHFAKSVEVLILSHNNIEHIAEDKFELLENLRVLDLSYNSIRRLRVNLSTSYMLEHLDLRGNDIMSLDQFTIDQLNEISRLNSSHRLRINLGDNDLICTCSTQSFVAWVLHSHPPNLVFEDVDQYVCTDRYSDTVPLHKVSMSQIRFECYENIVYGCAGAVSMMFLLGIALAYKKRFLLRHKLYKLNKRFRRLGVHHRSQHEYDAFICHEDDDTSWVEHVLVPRLQAFKVHYNGLLHAGCRVRDAVDRGVEESYRSVVVLSPSFISSTNCMFHINSIEGNMVNSGRENVIVIKLKPLNRVGLDRALKSLMEKCLCLEWKEDDMDAQNYFWERLTDTIASPCEEMYDTPQQETHGLLVN